MKSTKHRDYPCVGRAEKGLKKKDEANNPGMKGSRGPSLAKGQMDMGVAPPQPLSTLHLSLVPL